MHFDGQVTFGQNGSERLGADMLATLDDHNDADLAQPLDRFALRPTRYSGNGRERSQIDLHPIDRELVALSIVLSEPDASLTTSDRVEALAGCRPTTSERRLETAAQAVVDAMHELMGRLPAERLVARSSLDEALAQLNSMLTGRVV